MSEQNIQYEKTLQKGIRILKENPNQTTEILKVATRLSYLRGRLFEQIHQEKNDKSVRSKGLPSTKDEALTANISLDGGSLGDTAGCPGVDSRLAKGDTSDSTLPADLSQHVKSEEKEA